MNKKKKQKTTKEEKKGETQRISKENDRQTQKQIAPTI